MYHITLELLLPFLDPPESQSAIQRDVPYILYHRSVNESFPYGGNLFTLESAWNILSLFSGYFLVAH